MEKKHCVGICKVNELVHKSIKKSFIHWHFAIKVKLNKLLTHCNTKLKLWNILIKIDVNKFERPQPQKDCPLHVIKLVFQIKDELGWTALNLTIKFVIYLNHKKICWQDISLSSPLKGRVRKRRGKVCFLPYPGWEGSSV